jgi:catechol 2,3-dioxygenase-like lactoylglutathione lyase family enzyme
MRIAQALCFVSVAAAVPFAALAQPESGAQTKPQIRSLSHAIHAVEDLDTTIAFYRDVFGLNGMPQDFPNPAVPQLTNAPGVTLRLSMLRLPGAMLFELTHFKGLERKPARAAYTDPGAGSIVFYVRDLDAVMTNAMRASAPIVTTGRVPVEITTAKGKARSIILRDPDGFFVQVVQESPVTGAPEGNVHRVSLAYTIESAESTAKFYSGMMGLDLMGPSTFSKDPAMLKLVGAPEGTEYRKLTGILPGPPAGVEFTEFRGVPRNKFHLRVRDPGAPAMAIQVINLSGMVAQMKAAGVNLISANGQIVDFGNGTHNIFVEDASGMNIELFERSGAPPARSQTTPVVRLQNLAHTTESLDRTLPFYRDVLGLPMNGSRDPLAQQPQKLDEDMSKFTSTQGMGFRAAAFHIPNAAFGFELTEFTGGPRKPVRPNIQDIGAATLALQVRDIEKVLAKVKAAGVPIVTIGGTPVNPTGNPSSKMREIMLRDPDGFFVELQQPDPLPASAGSTIDTPGDILGAAVQFSIEDSAKTVAFLRDAIGFNARPTGALSTNPVVTNLIGLPGAQWRITHGSIPGAALDFGLIEYSGVARVKIDAGAQDPGSPAFTMVVRDIQAAVEQWTKAGGTVATTGGKPIVRANGAGNVFVRDVNGLMWELIQSAAQ